MGGDDYLQIHLILHDVEKDNLHRYQWYIVSPTHASSSQMVILLMNKSGSKFYYITVCAYVCYYNYYRDTIDED